MTNRKRFEDAMGAKLDLEPIEYADGSFHYYADRVTQIAWEAWEKACPEGWQAVPIEPIDEMLDAASKELDGSVGGYEFGRAVTAYRAQLKAAPKPEDL